MVTIKDLEAFFGDGWNRHDVDVRSEEHTSELQSRSDIVCRLLLEKKKPEKKRPRPESTLRRMRASTTAIPCTRSGNRRTMRSTARKLSGTITHDTEELLMSRTCQR